MKDEIFKEPLSQMLGFEFNAEVAGVFDDMVYRSIPFYAEVQSMIADFANHYYQPLTSIYDLGCSTGTTLAILMDRIPNLHKLIGIDNSQPMIEKSRARIAELKSSAELVLECADLRDYAIDNASVVVMNYTLQFVRPLYRAKVVKQIYDGLKPGGIFMLSEKVLEESSQMSQLFVNMYYRFKRRQGYSEMEISQKRECLENVLVPYKVEEQYELLREAGFDQVEVFFKWNNFASFVAVKSV